jgi:hypothetical protein
VDLISLLCAVFPATVNCPTDARDRATGRPIRLTIRGSRFGTTKNFAITVSLS